MRHVLTNLAVYLIAALIVGGAVFWAWMRSAQVVLTNERTVAARFAPAAEHGFEWETLGRESYARNCANCHGDAGEGWDQYPGLAHTGGIGRLPGGRSYFIDVNLYGLDTTRWRAPMPPMGHLPDVELAAVLNYMVTAFGGLDRAAAPLFLPAEIAERRDAQPLSRRAGEDR